MPPPLTQKHGEGVAHGWAGPGLGPEGPVWWGGELQPQSMGAPGAVVGPGLLTLFPDGRQGPRGGDRLAQGLR